MKEDDFRAWLSNSRNYGNGTVRSRVSNCKTIEHYEGDLDHHFEQDHLCGLVKRLTYSTEDKRQNQPARHRIPIKKNVYDGTATYKAAVSLYKQFRENWVEGTTIHRPTANQAGAPPITRVAKSLEVRVWPAWDQPGSEEILALAHLTVPFVRFLNPDVIRAVVDDNERHRAEWTGALQARQIDPVAYLWEKSPCAFPGVRRYAGSQEIAAYRGHTRIDENKSVNALALDDNDYPKHLWSFVFRGTRFAKFGPEGYSLAHLADHKSHGNRFEQEFEVLEVGEDARPLFGLYTSPSNTVYSPRSLIKPTDFVGTIRALLVRRAQQLYGEFCKILPPFLHIPDMFSPEWNVSEFKWADPVGTTKHIPDFLAFREARLAKLIDASGVQQIAREIR